MNLFFVERFSYLGGSKYIVGIILVPQAVPFVERFIIPCPYLGESTIRGFTVYRTHTDSNNISDSSVGVVTFGK